MIEYFSTDPKTHTLIKLGAEEKGCWIAMFDPTPEEIASVEDEFSIEGDDVRAALDLDEVSRIERNDDYTMFILDTPIVDKSPEKQTYKTIPIAMFETPEHVISVCSVDRIPMIAMLKAQRDLHDTSDIKGFTSDLLMATSSAYFKFLETLNRQRINLSGEESSPTRRELEELYSLDASLVFFKTSLTTNDTVYERYLRRILLTASEEVRDRFEDVVTENRQALETTKIYSEILDGTIDHFGLMMDYDLNRTMQIMTTATLVLCVPTVIGGLFGMNLQGIPLENNPYGFAIVTGLTAVAFVALLAYLRHLRWF